jgi:hypothetical protein
MINLEHCSVSQLEIHIVWYIPCLKLWCYDISDVMSELMFLYIFVISASNYFLFVK